MNYLTKWRSSLGVALGMILGLTIGCGQKEYEQLVTQKIAELKDPRGNSAPQWEDFTSPNFGFQIEAPGPPNVSIESVDNDEIETVSMTIGTTNYQVVTVLGTANVALAEATQLIKTQYEQSSYNMITESDADVDGQKCKRIQFENPDNEDKARVQVCVMPNNKTCVMAALGDYAEEDADRFFDSLVAGN